MNSTGDSTKYFDGALIGSPNPMNASLPAPIQLLSVGAVSRGSQLHRVLFGSRRFLRAIRTRYRELWSEPGQQTLHVAILHNSLSLIELDDACRFIRHRWPRARILVVRGGEEFLDDELYDERVLPTVTPELLLATIQRLAATVPG